MIEFFVTGISSDFVNERGNLPFFWTINFDDNTMGLTFIVNVFTLDNHLYFF